MKKKIQIQNKKINYKKDSQGANIALKVKKIKSNIKYIIINKLQNNISIDKYRINPNTLKDSFS